ncbi:Glycosyl transferase group 1 [Hyella patelloides LEGE 07179]|uniref:Glycosyl transferase group 1 n=1 Tax=Hyella patelloides LEGE 07179 TaxID=945734 RepID=A0A563VJH5_9CYAN|nr:hormogonium polysaccharide biosynthesis glycosyltransferase HpsP [Hyella patelloides]VEP11465.1 Glycosyl transferase group 1 [Hyella patelloides LEGE 07179]
MKILQIVPSISLVYGGPSQMVLGLSEALANQGIEVTLVTTNSNGDAGQPPLDVPLGKPIKQHGYEIIYFPCSPFKRYKFSLDLLQWLSNNAANYDLAHIHALFSPVSTFSATVARQKKLPYVLRPLGTLDPADLQKKKLLKKLYGSLLEKPNLASAAAVHFTSEEEAKVSERYGTTTNDLIIPLGVKIPDNFPAPKTAREQFGIDETVPLILFMSRIDPKKGLDLLLPALKTLQKEGWQFHFVLAGANPQDPVYENSIKEQITNSPLGDISTIAGFVQGEAKLALLQDANIFVLPSYYENFGIAVAEAMATQTPVLISNKVHIWEAIQDAGAGWITPCNQEKLTETLRKTLQNSQDWEQIGSNARNLVKDKYSWNAIAKQLITAYSQLTTKQT